MGKKSNSNASTPPTEPIDSPKRGKRTLLAIVDDVYKFLHGKGEVHQSILRDIVPSPSNRHILELIQKIQEQPYVSFTTKGRYTFIQLADKSRAEESLAAFLQEFYEKMSLRARQLKEMESQGTVSQLFLLLEYKKLMADMLLELEKTQLR